MPPLPQSISLHIGAHKTASSHLQNVLYRNREMLSDEGIRVYGPGFLRRNGRSLPAMFGLSWSENPQPRRNARAQLKFLAKGRKRLVFTEENFAGSLADSDGRTPLPIYPSGPERVAELVTAWAPVKTRLFIAIRNPASYMASAYSQTLFGGANVGPRTFRARNDWRLIDWADYVAKLRTIPALSEIYVWRQEDYDLTKRLILRRLLGWNVGPKVDIVEGRVNQGLSAHAVRQTLQWAREGKTGKLAHDARKALPVSAQHKPFSLYASSTLAAAQSIYDDQFARIQAMNGVRVLQPSAKAIKASAQAQPEG